MTKEVRTDGYQILVVNIKCGEVRNSRMRNVDDVVVLDVPDGILQTKDKTKLYDNIESFAYSTVSKKFGTEVYHCQVFLPLA